MVFGNRGEQEIKVPTALKHHNTLKFNGTLCDSHKWICLSKRNKS